MSASNGASADGLQQVGTGAESKGAGGIAGFVLAGEHDQRRPGGAGGKARHGQRAYDSPRSPAGAMPRRAAMRTSSATDATCIFS